MKLASFCDETGDTRLGAALVLAARELLVDVPRAYAAYLEAVEFETRARALAGARTPNDMRLLLEGGARSLDAVHRTLLWAADVLGATGQEKRWRAAGMLHDPAMVRFLPPVPRPGKIISCGANYREHVEETADYSTAESGRGAGARPERPRDDAPPAFAKFSSTMIGHDQPIIHPRNTSQLDYEGELCVVIGRRCKDVAAEAYLDVVAGFTIMNDVSMRDIQFRRMDRARGIGQFDNLMGKNLDTTAPTGPYLVTKDEIADPQKLQLATYVNGERRQYENTANMIFPISTIIAHYSRMTLEPGDIFTTGNPAGSALGRKPPDRYWLKPGDVVEVEIEGIGRLRNPVIAET